MAKVVITETHLENIADAIRTKTGSSTTYKPSEMADAIYTISGGGGIIPTGTLSITSNGTHNVYNYASANVQVSSTINNQNKTVSPSTSQQSITADSGYTGLGTVTVNAMPTMTLPSTTVTTSTGTKKADIFPSTSNNTYLNIPTGYNSTAQHYQMRALMLDGKSITSNGTYTASDDDLDGYSSVTVNVSGGGSSPATLKSIQIPSSQVISGTGDFDEITFDSSTGTVTSTTNATAVVGDFVQTAGMVDSTSTANIVLYNSQGYQVPLQTLPTSTSASASSGYTSKATISRSTSDQYINIPTGYNTAGAYYKISATSNGTVTVPSSISGTSATITTGTNTLTFTKTVSVTPSVTTAGYISSGTAGNSSVSLTASVTTKAAATITPGTSNQTIASGTYLTGIQTIAGDANLVSSNIISGKSIFGVSGSVVLQNVYTGSSAPSSSTGSNGDIYIQS